MYTNETGQIRTRAKKTMKIKVAIFKLMSKHQEYFNEVDDYINEEPNSEVLVLGVNIVRQILPSNVNCTNGLWEYVH